MWVGWGREKMRTDYCGESLSKLQMASQVGNSKTGFG